MWTSLLIAANIILVSFAIGVVFGTSIPTTESRFRWASPDLVAIGGYAGAVFGFLQAILVFVAQIRSQQDSSMLPLTSMFARKYHAFEILALSAGVAIANLSAAILDPLMSSLGNPIQGITQLYAPMLAMNLVLLPVMTALSLWMLASIIADAGNSDIQAVKPVVRAALAAAAEEDALLMGTANQFVHEIQTLGIKYSPYAHSSFGSSKSSRVALDIGRTGKLWDVDCIALERFACVRDKIGEVQLEFAAVPGQEWSATHGALAVFGTDKKGNNVRDSDIADSKGRLERALRRALLLTDRGTL